MSIIKSVTTHVVAAPVKRPFTSAPQSRLVWLTLTEPVATPGKAPTMGLVETSANSPGGGFSLKNGRARTGN